MYYQRRELQMAEEHTEARARSPGKPWLLYGHLRFVSLMLYDSFQYHTRKGTRELEDGSAVKGTGSSCRGLELNSQHPHDGCQQSITPVAEDLTPSSGL